MNPASAFTNPTIAHRTQFGSDRSRRSTSFRTCELHNASVAQTVVEDNLNA